MSFTELAERIQGEPLKLIRNISNIRLGYGIVQLADDPQTRQSVRLSKRENSGIGIDSDLPDPFLPKELEDYKLFGHPILGDYHKWSTFNNDWRLVSANGHDPISDELQLRVFYLMTDEQIAMRGAVINQSRVNPASGESTIVPTLSPAFDNLKSRRFSDYGTPDRTIEAMLENPKWRENARTYCRLLMMQNFDLFQTDRERMVYEMADQMGRQKFPDTARPAVDAMHELFTRYIAQMQH